LQDADQARRDLLANGAGQACPPPTPFHATTHVPRRPPVPRSRRPGQPVVVAGWAAWSQSMWWPNIQACLSIASGGSALGQDAVQGEVPDDAHDRAGGLGAAHLAAPGGDPLHPGAALPFVGRQCGGGFVMVAQALGQHNGVLDGQRHAWPRGGVEGETACAASPMMTMRSLCQAGMGGRSYWLPSTIPEVVAATICAAGPRSCSSRLISADFHAGGSAQLSGELVADGAPAPPGDEGVCGQPGFAEDG